MKLTKIAILIAMGLPLAGYYPETRVIWSPDAKLAAVLGADGLHLCDPQGKLSELLIENARRACWYPDSQQLCVVSKGPLDNWGDVDRVLTDEQRKMVRAESDPLLREILAYKGDWDKFKPKGKYQAGLSPLWIYLREKHAKELKAKLTEDEWKKLQSIRLPVHRIRKVYVEKNAPPRMQLLLETFKEINGVRISPKRSIIAVIFDKGELFVLSPKGKLRPVAEGISAFPDWSPDGQHLVYCKSNKEDGKDVQLGSITRQQVCDANGRLLKKFGKPEELAGVLFHETARIRCLRDGRTLFTSPEVYLPATSKDMPQRMNLFALDPARQPTVVRMIPRAAWKENLEALDFFRLSPDQKRLVFLGKDGDVEVLTLATGEIKTVQGEDVSAPASMTVPTWRNNEELCFVVPKGSKYGSGNRPEIVLWSPKPNQTRCLSKDWPEAVVKGWLVEKNKEKNPTTKPAEKKQAENRRQQSPAKPPSKR